MNEPAHEAASREVTGSSNWVVRMARLDRRLFWLALAKTMALLGGSAVWSFLAPHLIAQGHAADAVGRTITGARVIGALTQQWMGRLSDRVGRRKLLVLSNVGRCFVMAGFGYVASHGSSLVGVFVLFVLSSVLFAMAQPASDATVADIAPTHQRMDAYALQRLGVNLGWSLGPFVGGFFADRYLAEVFFLGVPLYALAALLLMKVTDEAVVEEVPQEALARVAAKGFVGEQGAERECKQDGEQDGERDGAQDGEGRASIVSVVPSVFWGLLLVSLMANVIAGMFFTPLPMFVKGELGLESGVIGRMFGLNGLLVVLLQGFAGDVEKRLGTRNTFAVGLLGYAAAFATAIFARDEALLLVVIAWMTVGEVLSEPAQATLAVRMAPALRRGEVMGTFRIATATGRALSAWLGGETLMALTGSAAQIWGVWLGVTLATIGGLYLLRGLPER